MKTANRQISIRHAVAEDIPFLCDAIIEAEKSGSGIISYCTIFEMNETSFRKILAEILEEDIPGMELAVSSFYIAEIEGKSAGALATWTEGESSQGSALIKATVLQHFIPHENLQKAALKRNLLNQVSIDRPKDAIILESVYVRPEFRGQGVFDALLDDVVNDALSRNPSVNTVSLTIVASNARAFQAYTNSGFIPVEQKKCQDPAILELIPSDTRVMLIKKI